MKLSGWGRYPTIESTALKRDDSTLWNKPFIATGNHRSYGDAALASLHLPMQSNKRFISFNEKSGLLTCEAGLLLSELIEIFLPQGWFLPITPGSKLITVGGAVASDVHGKNHHIKGCFSECVESLELLLPHNKKITCSHRENTEWFRATCGGMGLTGIITQVSFFLKRVKSKWIKQTTIKTSNLRETFEAFEQYRYFSYSAAWIDCFANFENIGRSLLILGEFADDGELDFKPKYKVRVPFDFPSITLNSLSIKFFNSLYYAKAPKGKSDQLVNFESFFYPLDSIQDWNRIYGKKGFVQFQFILPKDVSYDVIKSILISIAKSRKGSFLAVLKLHGNENNNLLSFPLEGYSLGLDFKIQPGVFEFINKITDQVINNGGRVYLTKDALLTREQLEKSYPKLEKFRSFRHEKDLKRYFKSLLSERLSI